MYSRRPDSEWSDSASEASSIRDMVLDRALLDEDGKRASTQAVSGKTGQAPKRGWSLWRTKELVAPPESDVPMGVMESTKIPVERGPAWQEGGANPGYGIYGAAESSFAGQQILTSMLGAGADVEDGAEPVAFWRPGAWSTESGSGVGAGPPKAAPSARKQAQARCAALPPKVLVRGAAALQALLEVVLLSPPKLHATLLADLLLLAGTGVAAVRALSESGALERALELSQHQRFSQGREAQLVVHILMAVAARYAITTARPNNASRSLRRPLLTPSAERLVTLSRR